MPFRLLGLVVDPNRAGDLCGHTFAHYSAAGAEVTLACFAAGDVASDDARQTMDRVGVPNAFLLAVGEDEVGGADLQGLLADLITGLCPHVVVAERRLGPPALGAFMAARQRLRGARERPAKVYYRATGIEPPHEVTTAVRGPGFRAPELFARLYPSPWVTGVLERDLFGGLSPEPALGLQEPLAS